MDYLLTTGTEAFETNTSSILPLAKHSSFIDKVRKGVLHHNCTMYVHHAPVLYLSHVSQLFTSGVSQCTCTCTFMSVMHSTISVTVYQCCITTVYQCCITILTSEVYHNVRQSMADLGSRGGGGGGGTNGSHLARASPESLQVVIYKCSVP